MPCGRVYRNLKTTGKRSRIRSGACIQAGLHAEAVSDTRMHQGDNQMKLLLKGAVLALVATAIGGVGYSAHAADKMSIKKAPAFSAKDLTALPLHEIERHLVGDRPAR